MAAKPETNCPVCEDCGLIDTSGFGDYEVCPECKGESLKQPTLPYRPLAGDKLYEYEQRTFGFNLPFEK